MNIHGDVITDDIERWMISLLMFNSASVSLYHEFQLRGMQMAERSAMLR